MRVLQAMCYPQPAHDSGKPPDRVAFELPWPLGAGTNRVWRPATASDGRTYLHLRDGSRAFRRSAVTMLLIQRVPRREIAEPVSIDITAYPPARGGVADLDNLLKPTLDALVRGRVLADDRFVSELRICRAERSGAGRLDIVLTWKGASE